MECKITVLWLLLVFVCACSAESWPDCSYIREDTVCPWQGTAEAETVPANGCICDDRLRDHNVTCSCTDQQLIFNLPGYVWMGYDQSSGHDLLMEEDNDTDPLYHLIVTPCTLNYCKRAPKSVSPIKGNFDIQCQYNRTGVLCGSCSRNYSSVFGSTDCKLCKNHTLVLILVFAIAGIILFAMISYLQITVDKGWLYMIVLYSNLVSLFLFFWADLEEYHLNLVFLPTALLSLQIGVGVCFYDGMSTVARAGLQFVFPAYLFLLMLLFTLLARRFTWFSKNFSPVKTFATLMIMCYISILGTCVEILGGVRISTLGGDVSYRWSYDPTQRYFQGVHLFLGIIAILLVIGYIIPFPIVLFSPWIAYKYTQKLAPFYDAFWEPFKPKFRFWLSIRLFVLFTIIVLSIVTDLTSCLYYSVLALLVFILVQLTIRPFKCEWQSRADAFLVGIAIALKSGAIFVLAYSRSSDVRFKIAIACLTVIALLFSYGVFIAIFYYSLAQRHTVLKKIAKIPSKQFLVTMKKKFKKDVSIKLEGTIEQSHSGNTSHVQTDESVQSVTHTEVYIPTRVQRTPEAFSRLRESLLETNDSVEL